MVKVFVNRFEVSVFRHLQDGVGDVFPKDLGDPLCDPFLDGDLCKAEDVLSVGFFLGVSFVRDFHIEVSVVGADDIGGRS